MGGPGRWAGGGGKGKRAGGKGGGSPSSVTSARSPSHHYFSAEEEDETSPGSAPSPAEVERQKKELKVKKKLREVEDLERRQQAGEQLEPNQLKKIATKPGLEEELRQLQPPAAAPSRRVTAPTAAAATTPAAVAAAPDLDESFSLQDVNDELELLKQEQEAAKAEEATERKGGKGGKGGGKGGIQPQGQKGGKGRQQLQLPLGSAAPSTSLRAGEAAAARARAWGTPSSPSSAKPPASPKPSPRASPRVSPRAWGREERLPIPLQAPAEQLRSLSGDLQVWASKFGLQAAIEGREVVARLGGEAGGLQHFGDANAQAAIAELKAIMRFTFGACGPSSPGPSWPRSPPSGGSPGGVERQASRCSVSSEGGDLADPANVFACCDTDNSGSLDSHELRFALNAFGLFPDPDYIEDWMDGEESINLLEFTDLLKKKRSSAPSSMRRPRAIPYGRRGVTLGQLKALHSTFVESSWLAEQCDAFNCEKKEQIDAGKVFRLEANLYALDKFVIRPVTSPEPDAGPPVPLRLCDAAKLPQATHKCSYSELVNPNGVLVDTFVSHYWGHPFADTMVALQRFSMEAHRRLGRARPEDMVFWLCFLALNQHRAGEEVGSSPEEGPFNAALMQASGAVMILDDQVNPFRRIWCLFEVKRLTDLGKDFELICSRGPVSQLLERETPTAKDEASTYVRRIGAALEQVSAFKALASSENDKYAIWHRVADPALRKMPLEVARKGNKFNESIFKRFDMVIRSLLAAPLFRASLRDGDAEAALRYIGMGAAFTAKDLDLLEVLVKEDLCSVEVSVKSSKETVKWKLAHCAAYFGHAEAMESLLDRAADLEAKTRYGLTPLMQATRNGHADIAELLIARGADVEARNKEKRTALHGAAHQGHADTVERLLAHGVDVHATGLDGQTALHGAASSGHTEVVQLLLSRGADPSTQNADGFTPLHGAAQGNHSDVARTILAIAGAHAALKKRTRRGQSALDLADKEGHYEVADAIRESSERVALRH